MVDFVCVYRGNIRRKLLHALGGACLSLDLRAGSRTTSRGRRSINTAAAAIRIHNGCLHLAMLHKAVAIAILANYELITAPRPRAIVRRIPIAAHSTLALLIFDPSLVVNFFVN
jgi:hypothetical protein